MDKSDIYESMIQPQGTAYRLDQIKQHRTHYLDPIDQTPGRLAGNSHIAGDASPAVQSRVIDAIIEASERAGLGARETGHVLAIARLESGFNPDAAAGTTTAYGLGQFVDTTGQAYDITDANRGDLTKQAEALVAHFQDNALLASARGQDEEYIYKYHHDGPVSDSGGLKISRNEVMPYVNQYEKFVEDYEKKYGKLNADPTVDARNHAHAPHLAQSHALLREGASGEKVGELQHRLNHLGYTDLRGNPLTEDRHFGPATREAVQAFQRAQGLDADGKIGSATQQRLDGAMRDKQMSDFTSGVPLLRDFSDPSHPQNALYSTLKDLLPPGTSEERIAQGTAACYRSGITSPDNLSGIVIGDKSVMFDTQSLLAKPAQMDISQPAPSVQQTMQQVQQFDQQQAQIQAQVQQANQQANMQQQGPVMGGPQMGR